MARGEDNAPGWKDRLRQAFRVWSGRDPEHRARGEPLILRIVAPLAVLIIVAVLAGVGFGYVLARQADDAIEAGRHRRWRQSRRCTRSCRTSPAWSQASSP